MPAPSSAPPSSCWARFVYQKISAVSFLEDKQFTLPAASSTAYFAIGSWDDHADNSLSVWAVDGWAAGRGAGMSQFSVVGFAFTGTPSRPGKKQDVPMYVPCLQPKISV